MGFRANVNINHHESAKKIAFFFFFFILTLIGGRSIAHIFRLKLRQYTYTYTDIASGVCCVCVCFVVVMNDVGANFPRMITSAEFFLCVFVSSSFSTVCFKCFHHRHTSRQPQKRKENTHTHLTINCDMKIYKRKTYEGHVSIFRFKNTSQFC